ncbi:MAG TPA: FeoB small GTPase domain-containing protein, partial [Tepidisphaeraceae bacterium]
MLIEQSRILISIQQSEISNVFRPMPTCHDQPLDHASAVPASGRLTVALAGNPNSGKTTIFNALTGL